MDRWWVALKPVALVFLAASLLPLTAGWFEATMARHMLLQMPLLGIVGACLMYRTRNSQLLSRLDPYGAMAIVLGTGCLLFWMLPLHLDLATFDPVYRSLKVLTVPLGIGACFTWAFLQANLLVKLLIGFEGWASIARLGWIYIESPDQLCSSYLIDEQQMVGGALLGFSGTVAVVAVLFGLFGSFSAAE